MTENKYEKGTFGWFKEQTRKDGFENIKDWQKWKRYQNIKNIDQVEKILKANNIYIKDTELFYRFWSNVHITNNNEECWNWMAGTNGVGYGQFWLNTKNKNVRSNRMAYILTKGNIPEGLQIQHSCNTTLCCNPNHLELGNNSKNMLYMYKCKRNNSHSKLTEDKIRQIHITYNKQLILYPELKQWQIIEPIAKTFKISNGYVWYIISGKSWCHIYKEFQGVKNDY